MISRLLVTALWVRIKTSPRKLIKWAMTESFEKYISKLNSKKNSIGMERNLSKMIGLVKLKWLVAGFLLQNAMHLVKT